MRTTPNYRFYVHDTSPDITAGVIFQHKRYTEFTGGMESIEYAEKFIREHGDFWKEREKELVLFDKDSNPIAFADGKELIKYDIW